MKVVSRYCDSCGVKIPAQDIEDKVALRYDESYYCKDCKADILPLIGKKDAKAPAKDAAAARPSGGQPAAGRQNGGIAKPAGATVRRAAVDAKPPTGKTPVVGAGTASGARPKMPVPGTTSGARPKMPSGGTKLGSGANKAFSGRPVPRRSESDSDEELAAASDEEIEAAPPKKRGLLFAGLGVAVLAAAAGVYFGFFAKKSPAVGSSASSSTSSSSDDEAVQDVTIAARLSSQRYWDAVKKGVKDLPIPERLKAYTVGREGIASHGSDPSVMEAADQEIDKLKGEWNGAAEAAFRKVNQKAQEQKEVGDYEEAIATMRTFPAEFRESSWMTNVETEVSKLEFQLAAKREGEQLERAARVLVGEKKYQVAIGVLEGFDAAKYRNSPWRDRLEKLRRSYDRLASEKDKEKASTELERQAKAAADLAAAKRAKEIEEENKKIDAMTWQELSTDNLFEWNAPEPKPAAAWTCDKSQHQITGKCGGTLQGSKFGATIGAGKRWIDYIVKFRYKIAKGSFHVGARATASDWVDLEPELISDGQWHAVQISVRGTGEDAFQQTVDGGVTKVLKGDSLGNQGGIAFLLMPQSEVVFDQISYKAIKKGSQ